MNKKPSVGPLDRSEWDFSAIPEGEWDACLFYEFSRENETLRDEIPKWRKIIPDLAKRTHLYQFTEKMDDLKHLLDDSVRRGIMKHTDILKIDRFPYEQFPSELASNWEQINAAIPALKQHMEASIQMPDSLEGFSSTILNLVAAFDEFPEKAWGLIEAKSKKDMWAKLWKAPTKEDVLAEPGRCVREITDKIKVWETNTYDGKKGVVSELIDGTLEVPFNKSAKPTINLFYISWNFRDSEIAKAFEIWVKKNRPPQYPEPALSANQLAIRWIPLKRKKDTLLTDLGFLRRREKCKDWSEFLGFWPTDPIKKLISKAEKEFENSRLLKSEKAKLVEANKKDLLKEKDVVRFLEEKCKSAKDFKEEFERVFLKN